MSKTRDTGFLNNVVKTDSQGNVFFVSGSTTLLSISSSGAVTTTGVISGSNALSSSYALNADQVDGLNSTSFVFTSSYNTDSSSVSTRVTRIEGNYATTCSNVFLGAQTVCANITSTGTIIAQTLNVQQVTSSVVYSSGSNVFGNQLTDVQQMTGSVRITGSLISNGTARFSGGNNADVNNVAVRIDNWKSLSFYNCGDTGWAFTLGTDQSNNGTIGANNSLNFATSPSLNTRATITSTGISCFACQTCAPAMDIMPSGIGVSTLGGIMRVVTTGTATGIAVGQSNSNRYTHIAANDIQVFNDDFFLSTRCAFPLSIGTCYTARLTFAATGIACFACQVCAPYFFNPGVAICGTNGNTWLTLTDLRDSNNAETTALHINTSHRSGGLNGVNHYGLRVTPNFSVQSSNLGTVYGAFITPFETGIYNIDTAFGLFVKALCVCSGTLTNSFAAVFLCGNVGIGTSSPNYPLSLGDNFTNAGTLSSGGNLNGTAYFGNGGLTVGTQSTTGHTALFTNSASRDILFGGWNGSTNAERMRITSGGNVAINNSTAVTTSLVGALTIWKTYGADGASVPSPTAQNYYNNQDGLYLFGRNSGLSIISANGEEGAIHFANASTIAYATIGTTSGTSSVGGDMYFKVGSNAERMRITSGGNVGINTTDPKATLHVCGGAATLRVGPWFSTNDRDFIQLEANGTDTRILSPNERFKIENPDGCVQIVSGTSGGVQLTPGATSWASMSDIRKKKNFEPTQGLAALLQIEPVKYHFQWDNDCIPKRMGFIAQNIQPLIPEMVSKTEEKAEDGSEYLTITPDYMLPVLVKAIQEQQCTINQLRICLGLT
jgi:hypothetical protein